MGLRIFTTPGDTTWTVPDGLTSLSLGNIELLGRGGNGVSSGGGGGGGGNAYNDTFSVTAGTIYDIHVGDYAERTWFNTSLFLWADPGSDGDGSGNGGTGGTGGGTQVNTAHTGGSGDSGTTGGGGGCAGNSGNGNNASGATGGAAQDNGGAGGDTDQNGHDPGGGGGAQTGVGGGSKIILNWNDGHITITVQPSTTAAGATILTITVEIRNSSDSVDTNAVQNCGVEISSNPSGGTLSGTTSVAPASGVYTFSDLAIDNAGSGYKLNFYKDNGAGGRIQTESDPFDITAPASALDPSCYQSETPYRPRKTIYRPY